MNADRTLLTDAMWAELSPLLPGQEGSCGVTATDTRDFVEAVLWLGRTDAPWRDLPPLLGEWHRVYVRFVRWRDKGVWEVATAWLIRYKRRIPHSQQVQVQVDSTSIRVHQHGTGAEKKQRTRPRAQSGRQHEQNTSGRRRRGQRAGLGSNSGHGRGRAAGSQLVGPVAGPGAGSGCGCRLGQRRLAGRDSRGRGQRRDQAQSPTQKQAACRLISLSEAAPHRANN